MHVRMYIYTYMYVYSYVYCICIHICVCIHIYSYVYTNPQTVVEKTINDITSKNNSECMLSYV